ncbi:MAG TPA: porin family protein [Chitinophaga sp.]|nr:porin family protein [Chitinophaga sp.]
MKKGLLLAGALAIFSGFAANAQRLHYGLKANLLFSGIHGEGLTSSFIPGFQGGAFFEYSLNKKWGIQPELLFTQATAKRASDFPTYFTSSYNTSANEKAKISALTVPVLLGYTPIPAVTLNFGVQYTYMFFIDENFIKKSQGAAFKSSDAGAVAGAQINVGNVRFYGRYVYGFSDLNNIPENPNNYKWKSQQVSLGIGVAIK